MTWLLRHAGKNIARAGNSMKVRVDLRPSTQPGSYVVDFSFFAGTFTSDSTFNVWSKLIHLNAREAGDEMRARFEDHVQVRFADHFRRPSPTCYFPPVPTFAWS